MGDCPDPSLTRTLGHMPYLDQELDWTVTGSAGQGEAVLLVHGPLPNTGSVEVYEGSGWLPTLGPQAPRLCPSHRANAE